MRRGPMMWTTRRWQGPVVGGISLSAGPRRREEPDSDLRLALPGRHRPVVHRGSRAHPGPVQLGHLGQRSEEHTSELQSRGHLVCRLLLEKKNTILEKNGQLFYVFAMAGNAIIDG